MPFQMVNTFSADNENVNKWRNMARTLNEKCYDKQSGRLLCEINNEFFRPMDKIILKGDSTKIRKNLGWRPEVCFESLIEKMISNDLKQNENELYQY